MIAVSNVGRPACAQWEVHLIEVDGTPWYFINVRLAVALDPEDDPRSDMVGAPTLAQARQMIPSEFTFCLHRHPSFEWPDTKVEAWL